MRVGMGYDVHRLTENRDLILGGVKIPWEKGLLGHSDADVLVHAIMDALLGAAALGDIGQHFPDTDPAYEGISSIRLLEHVKALLDEKGYGVTNIDAHYHSPETKNGTPYSPDARKYCQSFADGSWMSEYQGHYRGTTGIHWKRRGNCLSGCLPFICQKVNETKDRGEVR